MTSAGATDHPSVARVRAHAAAAGLYIEIRRFSGTTRTAQDAAREIGCSVAEIVKSLVFIVDGDPVVVLCSGDDRVDESKLASALGVRGARRATADEVFQATGFSIGGVAPFAHRTRCPVIADERLGRFATVWAAAGLPDAVFPIAPADLVRLSDARSMDVAADAASG